MTPEQDKEASGAMAPYFEMIGKTASAWAALEQVVDDALWSMAGIDHIQGACITTQIQSLERRLRALIALCRLEENNHQIVAKLNSLSAESYSLAERRNRIVHDPLSYDRDNKLVKVSRITANKTLVYDMHLIDLQEWQTTISDITDFRQRFLAVRNALLERHSTSR